MRKRKPTIALIYDFDGTLSPSNMQEYDFLKAIGIKDKKKFWAENNTPANYQKNDENFKAYYYQVIDVDAKAFALDCLDGANEAYNLIDFR